LRQYGTSIAKAKRAEEEEVISKISSFYQRAPDDISEEDKLLILQLQNKLDDLYRQKAEGAFVRSRKRWLEEGEQNSAYFFRLKRYRSKINSIYNLNINGIVTDDAKLIADFCSKCYSNLYSSKFNEAVTSQFLNSMNNIRQIDEVDKDYCDTPLKLEEVTDSLLKNNKSPGTDGLTAEFYKTFSDQLAPFLLQVFMESIENETLPPSLTQGLVTLIPKPRKDILFIDRWRLC